MSAPASMFAQTGRTRTVNVFAWAEGFLFVVVTAVLLATLAAGANGYKGISQQRSGDQKARVGLALIVNSVRLSDAVDAIGVAEGPQGQALVLTEHLDTGDFETRIYGYDGWIVEEYAVAGQPYTPGKASQLVESEHFSFSYADGLLTIRTDQGSADVALRSVRKGGAAA